MKAFIYAVFLVLLSMGTNACNNDNQAANNEDNTTAADTARMNDEAMNNPTVAEQQAQQMNDEAPKTKFQVTSPAFLDEDTIPAKYTCNGKNVSPPLMWEGYTPTTASLAIILEDPDAPNGTFVHWVIYNIPPGMSLTEDFPKKDKMDDGIMQGKNGAGKIGYTGPCPPSGTHRYYFHVYALNSKLDIDPGKTTAATLRDAMQGHIVGEATAMAKYSHR